MKIQLNEEEYDEFMEWLHSEQSESDTFKQLRKDMEKLRGVRNQSKYNGLNLTPEQLNDMSIQPTVKDGKLLFDRNNEFHRYIMEDEEEL